MFQSVSAVRIGTGQNGCAHAALKCRLVINPQRSELCGGKEQS